MPGLALHALCSVAWHCVTWDKGGVAFLQEFARLHLEAHKKQFLKTADADYCT